MCTHVAPSLLLFWMLIRRRKATPIALHDEMSRDLCSQKS